MDERLRSILDGIGPDETAKVAAGVLGAPVARLESTAFSEILKPHADARTIGIVRVSGTAVMAQGGPARAWSSVAKIIDKSVPAHWKDALDIGVEAQVYEHGLFRNEQLSFRPARCYHISRPSETVTVLWLEDLTDAEGPPFSTDTLAQMARHLGEWNAVTAANPPVIGFAIGRDFQVKSWLGWGYRDRALEMRELTSDPMLKAMYARQPVELAVEMQETFEKVVERSKSLPHQLSLADCPVSNFFHRPGETIAIDLAGLGDEPVGGDGGRFIGSALTFGPQFAEVATAERDLFESYADGMRAGGYNGSRDELRLGYLSEAGFYLNNIATFPTVVSGKRKALSREFFEKRFGMPLDEVGEVASKLIDLLPSYVAEARRLVG